MIPPPEDQPLETAATPAGNLKIAYYPDIDAMAYAIERNTRRYKLPRFAQFGLAAFLFVNVAGLPFALFMFDTGLLPLAVLVANVIFSVFVLPKLLRTDFKRYIRTFHGDIENRLAEVELTEAGFWSRMDGAFSFHRWDQVHEVENTDSAVHIYFGPASLSIPASAFAYREQQTEFAKFAYSRVSAAKSAMLNE